MPNNFPQPTVYLQSGLPATENRANTLYPGQLGSRFIVIDKADSNRAKGWQLVQLDSTMAVLPSAGAVAFWKDRKSYTVTTSVSTAGRGNVAGVFGGAATAADCTAQNVMCIQQKGRANVTFQGSPTSAPDNTGKLVIPSATDGVADCLAAGTAASYPQLGVSADVAVNNVAPVNLSVNDDENP